MTFNIDYEQSVQKENDQVLKGEVILIFYFKIVDSPVPRISIFSSDDNVNQDSKKYSFQIPYYLWILALTTNLNMIFCVICIAWLKFETHPSFLLNLKMAD